MKLNNKKLFTTNKKLKSSEVSIICRKISILIKSGCEITKILEILSLQSNKKMSKILLKISNHIRNGNSITESFYKTDIFSKFFISMLSAGELSGNLDIVMEDLAEYYEQEQKLKSKIGVISIYPSVLIIVSIFTLLFMLLFVVPNFQNIFENNGIKPPFLTQVLINMSVFINNNYIFILIIIPIVIILAYYLIKTNPKAKYLSDKLKLDIPFIKNIIHLVITTRLCRTLSILIQSGINIIDAIDISSKVIDNEVIYQKMLISKDQIKKGNSISNSMEKANIFSSSFISMLKVGEESGSLDNTLVVTNKFYTEELNIKIEQFIKSIEPTLTVIIGLAVGIFVIAMVMPIFDAVNSI